MLSIPNKSFEIDQRPPQDLENLEIQKIKQSERHRLRDVGK